MYRHFQLPGLVRKTALFSICILVLYGLVASAQVSNIPVRYFKNYFVTGDYAVAGVGLRGTGVNGFATGTINMSAVPCTSRPAPAGVVPCDTAGSVPADIVAAYLYWEAEETASTPSSINGFFRGNAIVGKVISSPNNRACLSSGGPNGTANGSGRVYRADVLRYLPIDHTNNVRLANGLHEVKLPDSGGNGNGNTSLADGATLVVVYRMVVPGQSHFAPLRAVVSYDGAYTLNKFSDNFSVTMGGFYQASPNPAAKMTAIVANGQQGFQDSLNITTGNRTATFHNSFRGSAGERWDNPTFPIDLSGNDASYSAQLITGSNQTCLTVASIWTSTNVVDSDSDGLLDVWETSGMRLDPGDANHAATFGGCAD